MFHVMCFGVFFLILEVVKISAFSCFSPPGQVLTFKELTWQTLRIEADATDNGDQDPITTPLRLITNQGRIQISLKRRVRVFLHALQDVVSLPGAEMMHISSHSPQQPFSPFRNVEPKLMYLSMFSVRESCVLTKCQSSFFPRGGSYGWSEFFNPFEHPKESCHLLTGS